MREKTTTVHAVEIDCEEMSDLSVVGMNTKEFKYQNQPFFMVEFEVEDYTTLLHWFELAFGRLGTDSITLKDRRTFWKLTFLCEEKMEEMKLHQDDDDTP